MSNKKLFADAIVDAKAVREAALINAKEALEEALTPSIQNMLVAKLNELDEEYGMGEEMSSGSEASEMDSIGDEEFDLSAILAELEAEEAEDLAEAKDKDKKDKTDDEKEEDETKEDETEEELEIKDMSVEDLKNMIVDLISQELNAEAPAGEEELPMDMGDPDSLEMPTGDEEIVSDEEEIDLEELLAELDSLDKTKDEELDEAKKKEDKEEMKEAIGVIKTLRKELNEVNLLNAKLLYVNKIFKAKNLSESQKLNVIASFDKATTPKEAKMVFESLNATLSKANKNTIKESLGFASKATGVAPKKQIVESNDVINRMQKLANIIK